MANDFVMIKNLLFRKINNVPIIVQHPVTYFSMDENTFLSITKNLKYDM
jgi:hypothetical protein